MTSFQLLVNTYGTTKFLAKAMLAGESLLVGRAVIGLFKLMPFGGNVPKSKRLDFSQREKPSLGTHLIVTSNQCLIHYSILRV